ncbi:MAG: flagellar hook-associated protein FlgK [Myxococcota bacterium]
MVLFDIMYLGQNALFANQTGVRTTSENIANVNTPGFSRREAVFRTAAASSFGGLRLGQGVRVETTRRILDGALNARARRQNSIAEGSTARANVLARADIAFGDLEGGGASAALDDFFESLDILAASPQDQTARTNVLATAGRLTETLNGYGRELRLLREELNAEIRAEVSEVNRLGAEVADLNSRITQSAQPSNDLLDRRDQLIAEIAQRSGLQTIEQDNGLVTVVLEGGHTLVAGNEVQELVVVANGPLVDITAGDGGVERDLTDDIRSGSLGGILRARDEDLAATQTAVDDFVTTFATEFNARHQAGFGLDGLGGRDFFALPSPGASSAEFLRLDPGLSNDTLAAASDPTLINGDNTNALSLAALRTDAVVSGQEPGDALRGLLQDFGDRAFSSEAASQADGFAAQQLTELQQSISGVSIDEEMANLLRFQQSFAASATIIRTADELTQDIIALKR